MTCEQIQSLLYLHRSGERTQDEEALLLVHLRTCESCRVEAARITAAAVRSRGALDPEPFHLSGNIMAERVMTSISARPDSAGLILRWFNIHMQQVQYALGSALAAICILFSVQSFHDAKQLEVLEQSMGRVQMLAPGSEALSSGIRGFSGRMEANTFQSILSLLSRNTGERPDLLIEYWKKKYPALAAMRLTGKPTEEERRILATEGAALLQELAQWIDAGGNHNEH